ncbi:glycosyltransferase [Planosporangium thailandense]|uniref:Glycosyltransferase n=1 Tax=Planosporangium thailandense TaxID=765197 RepID=A0ABX0XYZ7_9ACTN|nr:VTT domain-containing protein [Planosporangium thailandense]NJC71122.1 glycosyltransferase [Planosporangium thailandense]
MHTLISRIAELPPGWVYLIAALLLAAEVGLLCGLFVPAASIMLTVGALAHAGRLSLWLALVTTTAGALAGDSLGYWEGRLWGRRLREGWLARRVGTQRWRRAEAMIRQGGGTAVTAGRWVAFVRTLVPRLACAAGVGYARFLFFNAVGVAVWVPGTVLAGYLAGASYRQVIGTVGPVGTLAAVAMAVGLVLLARWRARRRAYDRRARTPHETGSPADAVDVTSDSPRPFLAAALIVRDERDNLPDCLASLAGVVDEIHVLDTGSIDGTPELAAELGATVAHATWNDDFAAARNAAVEGWSAEWVLAIDADNRLVADRDALVELLSRTDADVVRVDIDNLHDEVPYTHQSGALYRPDTAQWSGRVHEQLVGRTGPARVRVAPRSTIRMAHLGYAEPAVRAAKSVRNAELAQAQLDALAAGTATAEPAVVARTLLDLGRSLVGAGRRQAAVDTFETVRELFPGTPEWLQATDFLARLVLAAGLDEVCLALSEQLRGAGARPEYCDWLAAQALAQLGEIERAWHLLAGVSEVVDTAGRRYDPAALRELTDLVAQLRHAQPVHGGADGPVR